MDLKVRGKEQCYYTVYDVQRTAHSNITLLIQSFIIYIIIELLFVQYEHVINLGSVMHCVFFHVHSRENKMI